MPSTLEPLVLIVEDEKKARNLRLALFEDSGFAAIGAPSKIDAERELRACPSIDLLVTDVNLDVSEAWNKSGLELAKAVKVTRPGLPIVGYSGRLSEHDLPAEDLNVFDSVHMKGRESISVFRDHLAQWREIALQHRRARVARASDELSRIRNRYEIGEYDFNLLREFLPASPETSTAAAASKSVEAVLNSAGFRLKIVEAKDVPDAVAAEGVAIKSAIPIWLRPSEDHVVAEVYRVPDLYASGATDDEAIKFLLLLMAGYYRDLREMPAESLSSTTTAMRNFLMQVFG